MTTKIKVSAAVAMEYGENLNRYNVLHRDGLCSERLMNINKKVYKV